MLNGDIHSTEKRSSSTFGSYPVRIGSHSLLVFEIDDNKFDLRVDNVSFDAMFQSQKSNFAVSYDNPFAEEKSKNLEDPFKENVRKERKKSPEDLRKHSPELPRRAAAKTTFKAPVYEEDIRSF